MVEYPYPIIIYLSFHCNYRCSYCYNDSSPTNTRKSLIAEKWITVLDWCTKYAVPELRFTGGEPFSLSYFRNMCEETREANLPFTITTNGSLLNLSISWLSNCCPSTLWVSYHREYCTINAFIDLIKYAAAYLPRVGVNIFDIDYFQTADMGARLEDVGAKRIKIIHTTPLGRAKHLVLGEGRMAEKYSNVTETLNNVLIETRVEMPVIDNNIVGPATCVLKERPLLSINSDGDAFPCCITINDAATTIGNIFRDPILTIFGNSLIYNSILPCGSIFPEIQDGKQACPLAMKNMPHVFRSPDSIQGGAKDNAIYRKGS